MVSLDQKRSRAILIVSGVAVPVLAAGAWVLLSPDGSAEPARATQSAPRSATTPPADPPRVKPDRASRGKPRNASPSPAATKESAAESKPKPKKKYRVLSTGSCEASYYWEGQMTASGERFDPSELTAAHKTLPMDSRVRVTNKNNGRSVIVRINDRGPYAGGRCLDLSKAAMIDVGGTGAGVIPVRYQVLAR